MPIYVYGCSSCACKFEITHSIKEDARTRCPNCDENALERLPVKNNMPCLVYGEPTTWGQMSDLNHKKAGKEKVALMKEEAKQAAKRKQKVLHKILPEGATITDPDSGEEPFWRSEPGKILDVANIDVPRYIETGVKVKK